MNGQHAPRMLVAGALVSAFLGFPGVVATAQASDFDHRDRDRDCQRIDTPQGRERVCFERLDGRRFDRGDRARWHRFHHDEFGDCFRTPWGLACETDLRGVFTVRDRHRGDEPGPDCDLLIVEGWTWRCIDLPGR